MSEIEQIKKRVTDSNFDGIETSIIRNDYEPAGDLMIKQLCDSGEFISRRVKERDGISSNWKVFAAKYGVHTLSN